MSELKNPYYIVSPDYRESSGGIQALHKLCHQINLRGGSAWMVDCTIVNPKWSTPLLDLQTYKQHIKNGVIPIAVYPEIYSGNYLRADVCVRYMLNHEALLNGNRLNESDEDLFFWYSSQLIVKEPNVDFLTMVGPDLEMFMDDGRTKSSKLLYLNRVPEEAVNFAALPEDIIVISVINPRPLVELAEILKSATVMYTFEWSGTCNLAALCGVPVVSMVAPGYEKLAISAASIRDMGGAGVCFSDDERELLQTRKDLYKVREHMQRFEANFSAQLTHFFAKTQDAAQRKSEKKSVSLEKWLTAYPADKSAGIKLNTAFSLMIVVIGKSDQKQLDITLTSLANLPCGINVYPHHAEQSDGESAADFSHWLTEKLTQSSGAWVLFLHAGDVVYPHIFSNLSLFQEKLSQSLAFYSDRVIQRAGGRKEAHFLSAFDLDHFLAAPDRFASGMFFRREVCHEIASQRAVLPLSVEVDFLFRLVNADLESDIQQIPLPLLEMQQKDLSDVRLKKTLLTESLSLKGYPCATIDEGEQGIFAINYNEKSVGKITAVIIIEDDVQWIKRTLATFVDSVKDIDYELIIIDNFTNNQTTKAWLTSVADINQNIFRVFFTQEKISEVSALNFALSVAEGEFILYLACGVYFEDNGWLAALMNHCHRFDVAACAPALIDGRNNIFCSGLVDGLALQATEQFEAGTPEDAFSASESGIAKRVLLLSTECVMIRTSLCHKAGGFDEHLPDIQHALNDLLLCSSGTTYFNLFVPRAQVRFEHRLPATETPGMNASFLERWTAKIASNPGQNINLSLVKGVIKREVNPVVLASRLGQELKALFVADPDDHAETQRYNAILDTINKSEGVNSTLVDNALSLFECFRIQPKNIIFSDVMARHHRELFRNKSLFPETHFVVGVTAESFCRTDNKKNNTDDIFNNADALLVRNAGALKALNLKNAYLELDRLSPDWSNLPEVSVAAQSNQPRIGIVLAGLQPDDWKCIDALIKEMSETVYWIIYGACPDAWKPYIHEYHRKVPQNRLKTTLQSLRLQLALAPIANSPANRAEGHRIILQLGACRYPVLASDHDAYKAIKNAELIKNKTSQWRFMINKIINNPVYRRQLSENLYNEVNADWLYREEKMYAWLL